MDRLRSRAAGLMAILCVAAAPESGPIPPVPLAARAGRCSFVLPAGSRGDKYLLIVAALARDHFSHRIVVRTDKTSDPVSLPLADDDPGPQWRKQTADVADRLERARKDQRPFEEYPPSPSPPRRRVFSMPGEVTGLEPVAATLRGVGRHCLAYVDDAFAEPANLQPTVEAVIDVFDHRVFPAARAEQGRCLDVDRDGRFTMLFSPRTARAAGGNGTLSGFVLGGDFFRNGTPVAGNRCDMLYLSTDLRPGPFLRTLVAHEYTHAVAFSEHVFGNYLPGVRPKEEESWLNEGLAHLAEERHAFGWANLDYRVGAFLAAPRRYPLVVPDYFGSGLWRDPGCRGGTYLFLHSCARDDGRLTEKLVRSSLSGVANLEAATREPFAALFRRWTVALASGEFAGGHNLFRPLGGRPLCGVRHDDLSLDGATWNADVAGTAAAYLQLHSTGAGPSRVSVDTDADAELQVTLLPLAPDTPRLGLSARPIAPGNYQLTATAHESAVTLENAGWQSPAQPGPRGAGPAVAANASDVNATAWFGHPQLAAEESRASATITLPPGSRGPVVFYVSARDGTGRAVAGFVEVPVP